MIRFALFLCQIFICVTLSQALHASSLGVAATALGLALFGKEVPQEPVKPSAYIEEVSQENLRALSLVEEERLERAYSYVEYLEYRFKKLLESSELDRRKNAYYYLARGYQDNFAQQEVMDDITRQDLHVLSGPPGNRQIYLGQRIDRASTQTGKAYLMGMLAKPLSDSKALSDRQEVVKELLKHPDFHTSLRTKIASFAPVEVLAMSLIDDYSYNINENIVSIPGMAALNNFINTHPALLQVNQMLTTSGDLLQSSFNVGSQALIGAYGVSQLLGRPLPLPANVRNFAGAMSLLSAFNGLRGLSLYLFSSVCQQEWAQGVRNTESGLTGIYNTRYLWDHTQGVYLEFVHFHQKVKALALLFDTLKELYDFIQTNPTLKAKLPSAQTLSYLFEKLPVESPEFANLLELLSTDTFKGDFSVFSYIGRLLAVKTLFVLCEKHIAQAFTVLGEIDAYASIAQLYKEGQESDRAQWSFPVYVNDSQAPLVKGILFWNPFLDPFKAVLNTLSLGVDEYPRTALITGPNAGGKSTAMTGIVYCALLGQTIGIVPAKSFVFTPFAKIMTYLKITDDIVEGKSHFKAGVVRAHDIISSIQSLEAGNFSLTAVDEVFNGTTCSEGEAAAYSFIELLGTTPHNICLTTTHFPLVTVLEKETEGKLFKNYKVSVSYNAQGALEYHFKLEPGIADQNIAFDVLKEEGFDEVFLAKAQKLLVALKAQKYSNDRAKQKSEEFAKVYQEEALKHVATAVA